MPQYLGNNISQYIIYMVGLDAVHMAHPIGFESAKELLIHLHEDSLG